jgi:hypothetical protein
MLKSIKVIFLTCWFTFLSITASAATTVLYNGKDSPTDLGWLIYGQIPSFPPFNYAYSGTPTLDTNLGFGKIGYAGYTNHDYSQNKLVLANAQFPSLDRQSGFEVAFQVAVTTESSSNNRAGFSVIVISNDGKGVELGFKREPSGDRIFAQADNFQEAEDINWDISVATNYVLAVVGDSYTLFADDIEILNGPLRYYQFEPLKSSPPLPFNPYTTPRFLFLGDDTDKGYATFTLGPISITEEESVPLLVNGGDFKANLNTDGVVSVSWNTLVEENSGRFDLWRAKRDSQGNYVEIIQLVKKIARGNSVSGANYVYQDRDVVSGQTFYYAVAKVDFTGVNHFYDQVISVTIP